MADNADCLARYLIRRVGSLQAVSRMPAAAGIIAYAASLVTPHSSKMHTSELRGSWNASHQEVAADVDQHEHAGQLAQAQALPALADG